jgi:hypothetical protein
MGLLLVPRPAEDVIRDTAKKAADLQAGRRHVLDGLVTGRWTAWDGAG